MLRREEEEYLHEKAHEEHEAWRGKKVSIFHHILDVICVTYAQTFKTVFSLYYQIHNDIEKHFETDGM